MESIETTKLRIKTGGTIKSLIKTMKVLASINVKRYMKLVENAKTYDEIVKEGFAKIVPSISKEERRRLLVRDDAGDCNGYIIIGSDLGMCGQFNEKLVDFAEKNIKKEEELVVIAGEKAVNIAIERGISIEKKIALPKLASGDAQSIGEILDSACNWVFEKKVASIFCIYNAYSEKESSYTALIFKIFPIDDSYLKGVQDISDNQKNAFFFRIEKKELLKGVVRNYLFISIHKILCESIASENGARLMAMKYAEKNIEEYMEELVMEFNEARQEIITSELLGIVGGYEVLSKKTKK